MKCKLLLLFFLPLYCFSQKIAINEYDKFIKKQRIEAEPVVIHSSEKGQISLSLSSLANTFYLKLSGFGWGASTIDVNNELILLFSNDSTVTCRSTGLQTFEPGLTKSTYKHQYFISPEDVQMLTRNKLIGLRKYLFKDFIDLNITTEATDKIRKLSILFLDELQKNTVSKTLKRINLRDIDKYVGDSVVFCTKIYNTRYFESSENKPTLLDVQSDFSGKYLNAVILEQDRKNFNGLPEQLYQNKDVCITGVVERRNGMPYMAIHKQEQIKLLSPIPAE
jgi:hypothetical protein